MSKNILILKPYKEEWVDYLLSINNVDVKYMYHFAESKFLTRIIRAYYKFHLPNNNICINLDKNALKQYDLIILWNFIYDIKIIDEIRKYNVQCKLIFWFWNIFTDEAIKPDILKNYCECWSFDESDCIKYKINFKPTFYFKKLILDKKEEIIDACFIGLDKGRLNEIIYIDKMLRRFQYKTKIIMVKNKKMKYKEDEENYLIKKEMDYKDILNIISQSKCIIEIVRKGQYGITLRALEALFNEKKLITNNHNIINYDFYNANNIFIIGRDDNEKLKNFLRNPFEKISEKIVDKYDYNTWIKSFMN